jgi:hypothetical protein
VKALPMGVLTGLLAACAAPAAQGPSKIPPPVTPAAIMLPTPEPLAIPPPRPPGPDRCGASSLQFLVGRPRTDIPVPLVPSRRRVLCVGCPMDGGENPFRQTILYDGKTGLVTSVTCG